MIYDNSSGNHIQQQSAVTAQSLLVMCNIGEVQLSTFETLTRGGSGISNPDL